MNSQDYKLLLSFVRYRLKKTSYGNTRIVEPSDIVNEVYLKVGEIDIPKFKHEINKYLLAQKSNPKPIYLAFNDSGLILCGGAAANEEGLTTILLYDNHKECRNCRQVKTYNEFGTATRYATGKVIRLETCKLCINKKLLPYNRKRRGIDGSKLKKRIYANVRECNRVMAARFYERHKKEINLRAIQNYDPQKRKEKYLKAKMKACDISEG